MPSRPITALVLWGLTLTAAGPTGRGADDQDANPLDSEYPRLVEQSTKIVRAALKDKPTRRAADKARIAAMVIAAAAQENLAGPDGGQRASLRDAALAVADLIKKEDFAGARLRVAELPMRKPGSRAGKEKVKLLGPRLDVEDLMMQFRPVKVGGLGLEAKFDKLGAQADGSIAAKDLNAQLLLDAYLTAVTAELTAENVPKAKASDWLARAREMRKQALALGVAVKAKDGKASFQALGRLNRTCAKCHRAFRNN